MTHYWNVSLYFGDQLLFLVLVLNFRFLSARCGPTALTSTKGRNMALVCHTMLFTATTVDAEEELVNRVKYIHTGSVVNQRNEKLSVQQRSSTEDRLQSF